MKTSTRNILLGVMLVVGFFAARYTIGLASNLRTQLDEDLVYEHYQKQINAMRMFDAKTLCDMRHPRFRSVDVYVVGKKEETEVMDRDMACADSREAMDTMRAVFEATKKPPELKLTIESVTLSEDRREASVKLRFDMTLDKMVTYSGTGTDTLVRSRGKVYILRSLSRGTLKEL